MVSSVVSAKTQQGQLSATHGAHRTVPHSPRRRVGAAKTLYKSSRGGGAMEAYTIATRC